MTPSWRLSAFVRILTGVLFIASGYAKAAGKFVSGGFVGNVESMMPQTWPFWRSFLRSVVLPHATVFAWIVVLAELALGLALLLGFLTRIGAAAGVLLLLAILLCQSYVPHSSWYGWVTAGLVTKFAVLLLLLIAAVGHGAWGLDGRRRKSRLGFR